MPARTLRNLGLQAFFDLGEDGWDDEMSLNLLWLSVLVQGVVDSKVAVEPGAPADGDMHILDETHATHANEIAVRDDGAWLYKVPVEGWMLYDLATDTNLQFDGSEWIEFASGGGSGFSLPVVAVDADDYAVLAVDNNKYIRLTGAAAKSITVQDEADEALPANGEWHFRNAGAGDATFIEDTAVTINPPIGGTLVVAEGGTVTLKRIAEDEFDLIGVTVAA